MKYWRSIVVAKELHEEAQELLEKRLIVDLVDQIPLEELKKIFNVSIVDPKKSNHLNLTSGNELQILLFQEQLKYFATINIIE